MDLTWCITGRLLWSYLGVPQVDCYGGILVYYRSIVMGLSCSTTGRLLWRYPGVPQVDCYGGILVYHGSIIWMYSGVPQVDCCTVNYPCVPQVYMYWFILVFYKSIIMELSWSTTLWNMNSFPVFWLNAADERLLLATLVEPNLISHILQPW